MHLTAYTSVIVTWGIRRFENRTLNVVHERLLLELVTLREQYCVTLCTYIWRQGFRYQVCAKQNIVELN